MNLASISREDILKCNYGRTTDAWLYYELTYEPRGSGELKKRILQRPCRNRKLRMNTTSTGFIDV